MAETEIDQRLILAAVCRMDSGWTGPCDGPDHLDYLAARKIVHSYAKKFKGQHSEILERAEYERLREKYEPSARSSTG